MYASVHSLLVNIVLPVFVLFPFIGPFRGPSRALKYKKLRQAQSGKVKVEIPSSLGAAVGDRALQFVGECSDWVKEICPLNVNKWSDMTSSILDELYGKIKVGHAIQLRYDFF